MIGTLIVAVALAFAIAFAVAWWLRPALRAAIEAPKHDFAARVRHHESALGERHPQRNDA